MGRSVLSYPFITVCAIMCVKRFLRLSSVWAALEKPLPERIYVRCATDAQCSPPQMLSRCQPAGRKKPMMEEKRRKLPPLTTGY